MPNKKIAIQKYVAFLRGINVGGHKIIPMTDLAARFNKMGFEKVKTYIASGNVIFESEGDLSARDLTNRIEQDLKKWLGYEVKIFLRSVTRLENMISEQPFDIEVPESAKAYVTFLDCPCPPELTLPFSSEKDGLKLIDWQPDCVYSLAFKLANGRSGDPAKFIEKTSKVSTTTRNWNTVLKIIKLT